MCTRFQVAARSVEIARLFDARLNVGDIALAEMFPGRDGVVVGRAADGGRGLALMRWGFPPPPGARAPVVNVRNLASPFWRAALTNPARRCLVPVSRFAEWGSDVQGKKALHWFRLTDAPIFAFAGLWRPLSAAERDDSNASVTRAFAFLTCAPNPLVGAVHPKAMPVILHPADHDRWLDGSVADAEQLAAPFPANRMRMDC